MKVIYVRISMEFMIVMFRSFLSRFLKNASFDNGNAQTEGNLRLKRST